MMHFFNGLLILDCFKFHWFFYGKKFRYPLIIIRKLKKDCEIIVKVGFKTSFATLNDTAALFLVMSLMQISILRLKRDLTQN